MNKHTKKFLTFISAWLVATAMATASQIEGFVTDEASGSFLEGAVVKIPKLDKETNTNRRGYFEIKGVEPGLYTVEVRYVGAQTKTIEAQVGADGSGLMEVPMDMNVYELTDFTVSSFQSASARAANLQRSSENLRDIVASDHFGQFADTNAAEALNRLPGVSVERDQGEGRFVVIRGIDPNLNSVSIDGIKLASPSSDGRATLLDTIPIEVLDTLEVTKAVLPNQPGDSIGGHINLRSPSAFDQEGRTINLTGTALYSDLVDETGYRFNGSFADTFGVEEQWGLFLTFVNSERTFGSDNVEADEWTEAGNLATPEIQYREYDLTRERTGVSANLEFQANTDSLFFFRTSYNNYKDTEVRYRSDSEFKGNFSNVTANSFTNDDIVSKLELKEREENMRIWVASIGGEQTINDWTIDYTLAMSQAEEDTPSDLEVVYENTSTYTGSVTRTNSYQPRVQPDPSITNAANYDFDELTSGEQIVQETDLSAQANFKRDFDSDRLKYIQFGGLTRLKEKTSDFDEQEAASDFGIETADLFQTTGTRNPFNNPLPYLDTSIFDYAENNLAFNDRVYESRIEDYESNENVFAAYLMASFDLGEWNLIVGARVEHTEFETSGFEGDGDSKIITGTNSFDKNYTNFLPGIHFRREFREDLILRASWTNTIARPTFGQTSPAIVEGDPGEFELGNPDLDPYEAMNWDLSVQYYSQDYGNFGAALFYKQIDNFIYSQEFSGAAAAAIVAGATQAETFANGDSGKILGLELSYSKQFSGLPGVLSGLSLDTNLTLTDSEADAERPGGGGLATTPFIKQSDLIGSVSLAWEWNRYFVRLSGSYRDEYLDQLGEDEFEDRYVDDYFQVDLYSSVQILDNVNLFLEVNNLTNEPFRAYWKGSGRMAQYEEYGISGAIGVRASF